eukprot:gene3185-3487_t
MDRLKKVVNDFSKLEVNYGAIYVYALGICIMNGKQVILWNYANRRKKRGATSQKGLRKPYSLFGDILVRVYTNIAVAMSVANSLGSSSNSSRGRELSIGSKICSNVADTSSASQTDHGGGSIDLYSIEQSKSFHLSHHSHLLSTIPHNKVIPDIGVGETNEEDERLNFSENNEKSMRVSTPSVLIRPV